MTKEDVKIILKGLSEEEKDTESTFKGKIHLPIESANLGAPSDISNEVKKIIMRHFNNAYWNVGKLIVEEENSGHDWFKSEDELYKKIFKSTTNSYAFCKIFSVVFILRALEKITQDKSINAFRKEYSERDYTEKDFRDMKKFYLAFTDYDSIECQELIQNCMWSEIVRKLEHKQ